MPGRKGKWSKIKKYYKILLKGKFTKKPTKTKIEPSPKKKKNPKKKCVVKNNFYSANEMEKKKNRWKWQINRAVKRKKKLVKWGDEIEWKNKIDKI